MFGFIWVLLDRIAQRILKEDIKAWSDRLAIRDQEIDALDRVAERNRIELIELRAKHDREIESLQQTAREQAKCIELQTERIIQFEHQVKRLESDNMTIKDRLAKVKRFLDFPS